MKDRLKARHQRVGVPTLVGKLLNRKKLNIAS